MPCSSPLSHSARKSWIVCLEAESQTAPFQTWLWIRQVCPHATRPELRTLADTQGMHSRGGACLSNDTESKRRSRLAILVCDAMYGLSTTCTAGTRCCVHSCPGEIKTRVKSSQGSKSRTPRTTSHTPGFSLSTTSLHSPENSCRRKSTLRWSSRPGAVRLVGLRTLHSRTTRRNLWGAGLSLVPPKN